MIDPDTDRTAWRDLLIRMQTPLDTMNGANVVHLVDNTLTMLKWSAQTESEPARFLDANMNLDGTFGYALHWYGLDRFVQALMALPSMHAGDTVWEDFKAANAAYARRGILYRMRVGLGKRDDLRLTLTAAEDRLTLPTTIGRQTDPVTRLVWALFTLQTLRDVAGCRSPEAFIDRLEADIPEVWLSFLRQPAFQAILDDLAMLPPETLVAGPRRLQRRRRTEWACA